MMVILWGLLGVAAVTVLISYICFRMAFYADRREPREEYPIPKGQVYEPYRDRMVAWIQEVRGMPHEDVAITSFDGLRLTGRYYEYSPEAPVELMFHGYRGDAERDLCGGVQRCFALGHSTLIVDQRSCGRSEGHVISFGIHERRDCFSWLEFMRRRFGPEKKIILCGISMGASTVLMAAGEALPENVIGVLADCGYTSAKAIIQKVIREMKLPPKLSWPFVKLGARLFGGFDIEETTALESVKKCRIPVIFFHGEADDFVPCEMSRSNFAACAAEKRLVTMPNAGHGLCYLVDGERYLAELKEFFE